MALKYKAGTASALALVPEWRWHSEGLTAKWRELYFCRGI